jgi:hydroxymethylpyrimidine pyrophosphatase-like HAD family hydrolase
MRHVALATDYDGTLAHHGVVSAEAIAALERARQSGRKLILVTGRQLDELVEIFPRLELFDRVVAENGGVLFHPETRTEKVLTDPPSPALVAALEAHHVDPLFIGRTVVATVEPHDTVALATIRELGLELQVTFNKGSVMILPSGVNKATGLARALDELCLSPHNVVAVGDAENDHAFLAACGCAAAVANALPALKDRADLVLSRPHGDGVIELIDYLIADDLAGVPTRHTILLGRERADDGRDVALDPLATSYLLAGTSGSGKSTLTTGLLERLADARFQYVIFDPEGDYTNLAEAVVVGDPQHAPTPAAVTDLLRSPNQNVVINLLGIPLDERPAFFNELLPQLLDLRHRTGRPHLVLVDEAHHMVPAERGPARVAAVPATGMYYITVHPESVAPDVLATIGGALVVGKTPAISLGDLCRATGHRTPSVDAAALDAGDVVFWKPGEPATQLVRAEPPTTERRRHVRKYAQGNLGPGRNFVFSGPHGKLALRAQNLSVFVQMAEGVDDETWQYHLDRGDYSAWFRDEIKDRDLAADAAEVEGQAAQLEPALTREAIREAIERRYTLPADRPSGEVAPVAGPTPATGPAG